MKNIIEIAKYSFGTLAFCLVILAGILILSHNKKTADASITQGSEYYATSSSPSAYIGTKQEVLVKKGYGSLATVLVSVAGAADGFLEFYDATTSDSTLRDSTQATSSIFLFSIPNTMTAGAYSIDVQYARGLLMRYSGGGTRASSTVMYR